MDSFEIWVVVSVGADVDVVERSSLEFSGGKSCIVNYIRRAIL